MPDDSMRRCLYTDRRFHKRIVECTGNGRIVRFYEVVEKQIDRVRHYVSYNYEGRVGDSLAEHREICAAIRSEEHTSELQSRQYLVCRLLLEKKNNTTVSTGQLNPRTTTTLTNPA